jgi:hypothetical protein
MLSHDCTPEELRPIYERNGRNAQKTADEIGVKVTTLKGWNAYRQIRSPFIVTGRSTLRDASGETVMVWEKESLDRQREEEAREVAFAAMSAKLPRAKITGAPTNVLAHLLTLYSFFDYHVGMLAWHKEGGADWDLQIAERTGVEAMQMLVAGAPASDTAVINIGGDFLHFDGLLPITPTHGHVLDADSRFGKVVDVAIRLIRQLVSLALQKHRNVVLLIMEGNHDLSSSLWLRKMFSALFENEPRVSVHESELPYYALEWGVTMLGFHHGHLKKNEQLPALFAARFREMWGRCPKVYIHTGHRHHKDEKDHSGCRVTQHPTLAALDAHAARGGYFTDREITAITYNRYTGWAGTIAVTPEMLAA